MDDQQPKTKSKFLFVLFGVMLIALIGAGSTWFYLNTSSDNPTLATRIDTTEETQPGVTITSELDTTLSEIDAEIAVIEADEGSNDDTIDF